MRPQRPPGPVHRALVRLHRKHTNHPRRQRLIALLMIATGLVRVIFWTILMVLYVVGVGPVVHWMSSVGNVALLSLYANDATDWGQVTGSFAALVGSDAHAHAEHVETEAQQLLTRIRDWDHLQTAADGTYWRGEIEKVLDGR